MVRRLVWSGHKAKVIPLHFTPKVGKKQIKIRFFQADFWYTEENYAPVAVESVDSVVPVAIIIASVPVETSTGITVAVDVSTEPVDSVVVPVEVVLFAPGIVQAERRVTREREITRAFIKKKVKN